MSPEPRSSFHGQTGATLIELLAAVGIFIMLALAAAILYSLTLKIFVTNKLTDDLQREGDAILANMSQNLKGATAVDAAGSNFASNPHTLSVATPAGNRSYYVNASQLHYRNENGVASNLQAPGSTTTSLTFSTAEAASSLKSVTAKLTIRRSRAGKTVTLDVGSTITMRPQ